MACVSPRYFPFLKDYWHKSIPVPCGHCLQCKIAKKTLWNWRLKSEFINQSSAFVCLTYDDEHLPFNSGCFPNFPTLDKLGLHKYFDRLRHYLKKRDCSGTLNSPNFKYFACGEYGDHTHRPHYHVLFFGLDYEQAYKIIKNEWQQGSVHCGPILQGGISYVLKYITKSLSGELSDKEYFDTNREAPFYFCSHNLGYDFIEAQLPNIQKYGCFVIAGEFVSCPSYFRDKFVNYTACFKQEYLSRHEKKISELKELSKKYGYADDYMLYLTEQARITEASILARERLRLKSVYDSLGDYNESKKIFRLSESELQNYIKRCFKYDRLYT